MSKPNIPADILAAALKAVSTDRPNTHGDAVYNHQTIAAFWETYILQKYLVKVPLTAADVCQMMALFKIARTVSGNPQHADHYVDQAGYTALAARCAGAEVAPLFPTKDTLPEAHPKQGDLLAVRVGGERVEMPAMKPLDDDEAG